ncbi:hypothetical protein BC628DRAFT_1342326 [Trametes gibbosa]|nr:hypothetical protein BC628DRAFT_1342326 [Trametes gibbosa]
MLSSFPSPILSVAADVVRDLDGEDTLCTLWALFTKCKESLKDGRRLENISWRLWYREMASAHSSPASSPGSLSPSLSDRRSPSPITPISEDGLAAQQSNLGRPPPTPTSDISHAHSWHGIHPAPNPLAGARRLSTISTVSAPMERRKSHSAIGVGKMILDILPRKVDVHAEKNLSRSPAVPSILQPRPVVASVPRMQLPSTPAHLPATSFPHVVVIVPTPHPTPPATPGISHPPTLAATAQTSSHLLPPHPARSLMSASTVPSPTTSTQRVASSRTTAPSPQQPPAPSSSTVKRPTPPAGKPGGKVKAYDDETLKASDRRFFLQDAGSPDLDSPERPPSDASTSAAADVKEHSPSSVTSSHIRSDVAGPTATAANTSTAAAAKRSRVQVRKSKERHLPVRPALQRLHSHGAKQQASQRKAAGGGPAAEAKKAAFNIGSTSSNGSRAGAPSSSTKALSQNGDASSRTRPSSPTGPVAPAPAKHAPLPPPLTQLHAKQKQKQPPAQAQPAKNAAGPSQPRRGIVVSTSSEYETTDTDNESDWASEADSGEEREKAQKASKGKAKAQSHAQAAEEARLREAAEEAQRQRDMFAKVPKRSYSNNMNRTRSGLLSQLLNPDPNIFPPNHPYRTTRSTQDMTLLARQGPAPMLQMSKSTVAVPLATQVTTQAAEPPRPASPPHHRGHGHGHGHGGSNGAAGGNANGYRPKGRPQEAELEDTESEDDNPDDTIQVSRSLAQQKLAALADPNRRRNSDRGLLTEQQQQQQQQRREQQAQFAHMQQGRPAGLTTVATAPIPLNHPYNLPAPAPPMTPRTTRRAMLQTELSESLRRNLLWERQVSKVKITSRRGGVLGSGLRPLTAMNGDMTQQQLQQQHGQLGRQGFEGQQPGQGYGPGASKQGTEDMEERRRKTLARNRSWADDYHYSGW